VLCFYNNNLNGVRSLLGHTVKRKAEQSIKILIGQQLLQGIPAYLNRLKFLL